MRKKKRLKEKSITVQSLFALLLLVSLFSNVWSQYTCGSIVRTFRLAIAASGEFTQANGGTKESALAVIQKRVAELNAIYLREFSIRFVLVPNNMKIIFTDPKTDLFITDTSKPKKGDKRTAQTLIEAIIGIGNYDIGLAFFHHDQDPRNNPNWESFDSEDSKAVIGGDGNLFYFAHQLAHQLGANHIMNKCIRYANSAYEPGSGNTIMSFPNTCSSVANQVGPLVWRFNIHNFEEVMRFVTEGKGQHYGNKIGASNTPPKVSAGSTDFTFPIDTPFVLTGSASDKEDEKLTYTWEQYDLGPMGDADKPRGNAPIFRAFPDVKSLSRTFPQINDIVKNIQTPGEILPSYTRVLTFRFRAYDNHEGGGGVAYQQMNFFVTHLAGPFRVTAPNNRKVIWISGTKQTVTWDTASTEKELINCTRVNIHLSINGGYTYPIALAKKVLNNGSYTVIVPKIHTSKARISVASAHLPDHFFFDISDENFIIAK
jgi:Metallo-peptidase family M12B Reprolysin-like